MVAINSDATRIQPLIQCQEILTDEALAALSDVDILEVILDKVIEKIESLSEEISQKERTFKTISKFGEKESLQEIERELNNSIRSRTELQEYRGKVEARWRAIDRLEKKAS